VFHRGLKTNIAITMAVILILAMVLIDFIMVIMTQQDMIHHEVANGNKILSLIEARISTFSEKESIEKHLDKLDDIRIMLNEAGFSCTLILDVNNNPIYIGNKNCIVQDDLMLFTKQAIESGKQTNRFLGTTWGVFWKQRRNLIMSSPLFRKGKIAAGATFVFHLKGFMKSIDAHNSYCSYISWSTRSF